MLVILFLASVARFYHRGTGFTALIAFPAGHETEVPAMREVSHYDYPWGSYDGQFYAQMALDPMLRDATIDRAMDLPPYRARRILFSWTAWAIGIGRPHGSSKCMRSRSRLLVVPRGVSDALDTAHERTRSGAVDGMPLRPRNVWSVRFALLDVPSLVLIALAVAAVEKGRPLLSAAIIGISALGRETNLLASSATYSSRPPRAVEVLLSAVLIVLPLFIWADYLRSIYRSTIFAQTNKLMPGTGLYRSWRNVVFEDVKGSGLFSMQGLWLCLLIALAAQAVYSIVRRDYAAPWWRIGVVYAALMLVLDRTLADPLTGAITRVLLPMTVGFNIQLASEARWTLDSGRGSRSAIFTFWAPSPSCHSFHGGQEGDTQLFAKTDTRAQS